MSREFFGKILWKRTYLVVLMMFVAVVVYVRSSDDFLGSILKLISSIAILFFGLLALVTLHLKTISNTEQPPKEKAKVEKEWRTFIKQLTISSEHFEGCSEDEISNLMRQYDFETLPQPYIAFLQRYGRGAKNIETAFKFEYDNLPIIMNRGLEIASQIPILSKHKIFIFAELPYKSANLFLYFYQANSISEGVYPTTEDELIKYNSDPPVGAFSSMIRPFSINYHLLGVFDDSLVIR